MVSSDSIQSALSPSFRWWRYRIFFFTWASYVIYYFSRKNFPVTKADLISDLALTEIQLGYIETAYLALYAVGQFCNGALGDVLGGRRIVAAGMLLSAILNLLFGLPLSTSVLWLSSLWALNGYVQSTGWPGNVQVMAQWYGVHERGTVMGLWCTNFQIGGVIANAFAALLLAYWGWRSTYIGPFFVVGIFAVLYFFLVKETPKDAGFHTGNGIGSREQPYGTSLDQGAMLIGEEDENKWAIIKQVLRVPMVWYMGFTYFCLKFIRYGLIFWLPLYFVQEMGYSPAHAGLAATLFEIGGVPSVIVIGLISDRFFQSRRGPISSLPLFFLAGFCLIQHLLGRAGPMWAMMGFAMMGFTLYGPDSLMCGAGAMDFGTKKGASTAAGLINGLGSVGAIFQGLIIPRLKLLAGWHGIFILFFAISLISAFIMLSQWNTVPDKE